MSIAKPARVPAILAFDIGGSGIKAMRLDPSGKPLGERNRLSTPHPARPAAVLAVMRALAAAARPFDKVAVGFPGVVRGGVVWTATNLHDDWVGFDLAKTLRKALGKPVRVANDADVQGMGAIKGRGVELVVTLGTGFGSALFVDGVLVPNLELGHHPFRRGETYEEQLGEAALGAVGPKRWNRRLGKAIKVLTRVYNFDALRIGGGNGRKVTLKLPANVSIVPNTAGLSGGAALWRDK
ncbi:MAG: transcriptional regulator/sugar kinase [Elusimicrobia bacterium]|nr:MAG: transcriptional regulator/sugar kinase [Elusimicrobiota bacterium]